MSQIPPYRDVADVQQFLAGNLATALADDGWQESPAPPDLFALLESSNLLHKCYAVAPGPTTRQHEKIRRGDVVSTQFTIRWSWKVGAQRQLASFLEACSRTVEGRLKAAVLRNERGTGVETIWESSDRFTDPETNFVLGAIEIRAKHIEPPA